MNTINTMNWLFKLLPKNRSMITHIRGKRACQKYLEKKVGMGFERYLPHIRRSTYYKIGIDIVQSHMQGHCVKIVVEAEAEICVVFVVCSSMGNGFKVVSVL